MNFNIMDILNVPFGYVLEFCNKLIPSYILALLVFTLITKIILFPFYIKQQKSQVKQAKLAPREMAIKKKYAGRTDKPSQQKMQEEIMELYKTEGYNPVGGCLPLLLQFPILISLYEVIRNPLTYICHLDATGIKDGLVSLGKLALEDGKYLLNGTQITSELDIINLVKDNFVALQGKLESLQSFDINSIPNFNLFGTSVDLSQIPTFQNWLWIIPVLTFVFAFLSSKLIRKLSYQAPSQNTQQNSSMMKVMDIAMPLFSVYIAFKLPSLLGIYWIYQNIFMVIQQLILRKMFPIPKFDEEEYKKAEKEFKQQQKSIKKEGKAKSLHHIDDGEVYVEPDEVKKNSKSIDDDAPVLKDDSNGETLTKKSSDKPKVRSLHHIDDEEVAAERELARQQEIEKKKLAEQAKKEKLGK